jgi:hypothetical protein
MIETVLTLQTDSKPMCVPDQRHSYGGRWRARSGGTPGAAVVPRAAARSRMARQAWRGTAHLQFPGRCLRRSGLTQHTETHRTRCAAGGCPDCEAPPGRWDGLAAPRGARQRRQSPGGRVGEAGAGRGALGRGDRSPRPTRGWAVPEEFAGGGQVAVPALASGGSRACWRGRNAGRRGSDRAQRRWAWGWCTRLSTLEHASSQGAIRRRWRGSPDPQRSVPAGR